MARLAPGTPLEREIGPAWSSSDSPMAQLLNSLPKIVFSPMTTFNTFIGPLYIRVLITDERSTGRSSRTSSPRPPRRRADPRLSEGQSPGRNAAARFVPSGSST